MKSHKNIIVENLTAKKYASLTVDFLVKITNESERGAVLIGANAVDEYLEKLVLAIIPDKTNSYKNRLLKYPGALSSFSGKIELLYAFNIIDNQLYKSLNTLRKIRNNAAHSSNEFTIQNIQDKMDEIYEFEIGFKEIANKLASDQLMKFKEKNVEEALKKEGLLEGYDYQAKLKEEIQRPENEKIHNEHLTIWRLSYGLVFLCLKIEAVSIEYCQQNPV